MVSDAGERYAALLQKIIPELQRDGYCLQSPLRKMEHLWNTLLRSTFRKGRVISRSFPHASPPRSPDLAPCDFWLWGFLKLKGYRENLYHIDNIEGCLRPTCACHT
ncbi:hypothetical protein AVEN_178514-1 [Araneus ventricosus]|uniref:Transposase n=1 Tax=Araneus ventricosus TaxID=182803 RepID=A0A4Y2CFR3_ARAVE|nr:hypothetical protein AVEN_178514-1 [Araneus ventricosus]